MPEEARKLETEAAEPEASPLFEIPNDDTFVIEDGVTVEPPATPEPDVKPDGQSDPQPEAEESLLDAARKAIEGPSDPDPKEVKPDQQTGDEPEAAQTDLSAEPTDEELGNYSKKAQARIRSLVEQRNQATAKAEQVAPIIDYMQQNDIPQQDLDVILDLTARLRHGDFAGFLQGVTPYVNMAMQHTGQALPPDLQDQVSKGYVSPQIAKELAQQRAKNSFGQQQAERVQARTQQNLVQERATNIRNAITNWETQTRAADPDYNLKAEVVRRTAQALMQERGVPQTAEVALQYVKEAYEEVNKQVRNFQPQPKATVRTPQSTASKGGTVPQAEPTSMMEAAVLGLQAARG